MLSELDSLPAHRNERFLHHGVVLQAKLTAGKATELLLTNSGVGLGGMKLWIFDHIFTTQTGSFMFHPQIHRNKTLISGNKVLNK